MASFCFKQNFKLLFYFSLLCVFFFLLPLLFHSLKPFLMQFFSNIIDKSYMFLLSNTLLGFIAFYSSIINSSSSTTYQSIEYVIESEKGSRFELYESESDAAEPIAVDNFMENESQTEEENSLMIVEPENVIIDLEEDQEDENALMIIDEYDTEELNKKCEDFIKKMKAAFCSDSRAEKSFYFDYYQNQKSLVLVN
ncbi:uncharacterized protein [Cicer arietinum]|uniref:Uncharacterized protein LOC101502806 n=1 Tax=Cicer arietinum TaxID=3827 RepID=A0A1S2XKB2_CICAR|nr:uncharacterized protein LOC101510428 [Cicer arietinum]XP_004506923.1 uncharacterized protein LOC101512338 [Cicer arietinum]XP_004509791.3 uncharacterized protein LOC101502806 [Cicer arietinum]XP_027189898.1 uncharacterized protein LOC113786341 [Cicer arietinum]